MPISVTSSQVRPLKGAKVRRKILAAAASAGLIAYIANDSRIAPADKDSATTAHGRGIILADGYGSTSYQANQTVDFVTEGPVGGYSGLTPGGVCYVGDDGQPTQTKPGSLSCVIGYAEDDSTIYVQPQVTVPA